MGERASPWLSSSAMTEEKMKVSEAIRLGVVGEEPAGKIVATVLGQRTPRGPVHRGGRPALRDETPAVPGQEQAEKLHKCPISKTVQRVEKHLRALCCPPVRTSRTPFIGVSGLFWNHRPVLQRLLEGRRPDRALPTSYQIGACFDGARTLQP